jgi:ribosome-associated toxin RatA of RatAB toxin-antitoxin module
MPQVKKVVDIAVPSTFFFDLLLDIERYPSFLKDVIATRILRREGDQLDSEFTVQVIRRVEYAVQMEIERPNRLSWSTLGGRLFRENSGSWELEAMGAAHTRATYTINLEVNAFVPGPIAKRLVEYTLPAMLTEWKDHAEKSYGEPR